MLHRPPRVGACCAQLSVKVPGQQQPVALLVLVLTPQYHHYPLSRSTTIATITISVLIVLEASTSTNTTMNGAHMISDRGAASGAKHREQVRPKGALSVLARLPYSYYQGCLIRTSKTALYVLARLPYTYYQVPLTSLSLALLTAIQ